MSRRSSIRLHAHPLRGGQGTDRTAALGNAACTIANKSYRAVPSRWRSRVDTTLMERLFSAYLAYLPWLIFVIGLSFMVLGATAGHRSRRLSMIGIGVTVVGAVWLLAQLLA